MYRSPDPEPDPPPETGRSQPDDDSFDLGIWLFSPVGAIVIWLLTIGLTAPIAGLALLLLPERYGFLAAGCGLWLVLGLIIIHWWLPPGSPDRRHAEGLAIAGWHVLATAVSTGLVAWLLLFPDGRRPVFTPGDVLPVVVVGAILLTMFGAILTLLRGYIPGRGLRYAWTFLCMLTVWMTLWLVAAHGGLA